jgi:hypothetical protein
MKSLHCRDCRFESENLCHRFPPQMVNCAPDNQNQQLRWPVPFFPNVTLDIDWCGEWRAKE